MSIIGLFFPDILGLIGKMERFHPRIALRWLLGRVFILYFLNLGYCTILTLLGQLIGGQLIGFFSTFYSMNQVLSNNSPIQILG